MAKPKVKVTINGKQQRQNSNHNRQQHYGDEIEVRQTNQYLVLNPLEVGHQQYQEVYISGGK